MFGKVKRLFSRSHREAQLQEHLEKLRQRLPVPTFWLFGKTQSGKTSAIKYLTGADGAEIGRGFQPCTRFSRRYQFPTAEAPLLSFLDTRGLSVVIQGPSAKQASHARCRDRAPAWASSHPPRRGWL